MARRIVSVSGATIGDFYSPPASVGTGLQFEEYVFRQLAVAGAAKGRGLRLQPTPRSGDDGRDLIIQGEVHSIFRQSLPHAAQKLVCEVKYSSGRVLQLSKFSNT